MNIRYENHNYLLKDPNVCPHCHVTIIPKHIWNVETKDENKNQIYLNGWVCTNVDCNRIFVAEYKFTGTAIVFSRFLNGLPKGPIWPKPILELKSGNLTDNGNESRFIKTYLQSLSAESYGLDELAGMGYRKAIEYLVKDWAVKLQPDKKEIINSLWLGNVINQFYSGELKEILERATWLGNDQAHYNKLFEEFDLNVLKELIDLILVELDREYKKEHYLKA
jgi:hypothetical protein